MTCFERLAAAILTAFLLAACHHDKAAGTTAVALPALPAYDAAQALHPKFDAARTFAWAQALTDFGPRPSGSDALEKTRVHLEAELKKLGWETQRQAFEDTTPRGRLKFANIRARFPGPGTWDRPAPFVIASHYDTKFYTNLTFVGANDGSSGNAVMLEMARLFAQQPALAQRLELVFFDGEEASVEFTPLDGLHGSRHYAKWVRSLDRPLRPVRGLVLDMVGDKDLLVRMPPNSSARLRDLALAAAKEAGTSAHFGISPTEILDDHVPLMMAGVEMCNFIDLDYRPWHTAEDTMDKISAESLGIVGRTAVLFVEKHARPQ